MLYLPLLLAAVALADEAPVFDMHPAPLQDEEAAPEGPDGKWTGAFTVGANISSGNTEATNASATFDAVSETEEERWTVGLNWAFASEDGSGVTQRQIAGRGQYDRFIDEHSYYFGNLSLTNDLAAALDLRSTLGVGYGRQFRNDATWKIKGEAGLSYVDENFVVDEDDANYVAVRLAYALDWVKSARWTFGHSGEVLPSLDDSQDIYSRTDTRAKAKLSENMFAQFQWIWDWDNSPAMGKQKSDHLYLITIGWTF
jgi:putative salt-induced outer membrane protein YdiY